MNVKKVEALSDFRLVITYSNTEKRVFDMKSYWLWNKGDFIKLHDIDEFKKVSPVFDTVQWQNGLEIAPEELYDDSINYGVTSQTFSQ